MFDQSLIDLSKLVGGDSFTKPCTLSLNGIGVTTQALCDTGANGFLFINTFLATTLSSLLGAEIILLDKPIPLKGFDGQASSPVTQAIFLNLAIDGRRQLQAPFLMIDIGGHDLIIGRKWFSYFNIYLDSRNQRLLWPPCHPPTPYFSREIIVPRDSLRQRQPDARHQDDIRHRQRLLDIEDSRTTRKGSVALYTTDELEPNEAIPGALPYRWPSSHLRRNITCQTQWPPAPTVEDFPEPASQDESLQALLPDLSELPVRPASPDSGYESDEP